MLVPGIIYVEQENIGKRRLWIAERIGKQLRTLGGGIVESENAKALSTNCRPITGNLRGPKPAAGMVTFPISVVRPGNGKEAGALRSTAWSAITNKARGVHCCGDRVR